jgi:hypothetical protein
MIGIDGNYYLPVSEDLKDEELESRVPEVSSCVVL